MCTPILVETATCKSQQLVNFNSPDIGVSSIPRFYATLIFYQLHISKNGMILMILELSPLPPNQTLIFGLNVKFLMQQNSHLGELVIEGRPAVDPGVLIFMT